MKNNQFLKNLIINALNLFVRFLLGFIIPPLVIKYLGISYFGIMQVSISMGIYMGILATSLNQANNRFVAVSIKSGDFEDANRTLNSIVFLYIFSMIIMLPLLYFISINADKLFDINGIKDKQSVIILFLLVGISNLLVMLESAFTSPIYANNRLDIIKFINIIRNISRFIFIYFSIKFISASLISIGWSFFLSSFISAMIALYLFIKFAPFFKFSLSYFSFDKAKSIFLFSWWIIVWVIGNNLFFFQTDVVLVNIFLGAKTSGLYAIIVQWNVILLSMITVLSVVISPLILIKYGENKIDELKKIFYKSVRYQGLFSVFLSMIIFVYADTILKLWLGETYMHLSIYIRILTAFFGFYQSARQIYTMNMAFNKVQFHGLAALIIGGFHIVVSIILLKYTTLSMLGVLMSNVCFSCLLNLIIYPIFVSKYINEPIIKFYKELKQVILFAVIVLGVGFICRKIINPQGWGSFLGSSILTVVLILFFSYFFIINNEEKLMIKKIAGKFL